MSLLSKVLRDRRSQAGLGQVWSRMFRWDAKPDNIQVSLSQVCCLLTSKLFVL